MDPISETVAETVAATIPETIVVSNIVDYTPVLNEVLTKLQSIESAALLLTSFALFAVVVCLCYFVYKFFRIFF